MHHIKIRCTSGLDKKKAPQKNGGGIAFCDSLCYFLNNLILRKNQNLVKGIFCLFEQLKKITAGIVSKGGLFSPKNRVQIKFFAYRLRGHPHSPLKCPQMGFLGALRRWAIKGKGNYGKRAFTPLKTQKTTKFKKKPLYATKGRALHSPAGINPTPCASTSAPTFLWSL